MASFTKDRKLLASLSKRVPTRLHSLIRAASRLAMMKLRRLQLAVSRTWIMGSSFVSPPRHRRRCLAHCRRSSDSDQQWSHLSCVSPPPCARFRPEAPAEMSRVLQKRRTPAKTSACGREEMRNPVITASVMRAPGFCEESREAWRSAIERRPPNPVVPHGGVPYAMGRMPEPDWVYGVQRVGFINPTGISAASPRLRSNPECYGVRALNGAPKVEQPAASCHGHVRARRVRLNSRLRGQDA